MTAAADTTLVVLDILGQKVFTINGDGEEVNVLRTGLDKAPDGVFIDTARGHVYATMMGTVDMKTQTSHVEDGAVWRINLDGSDPVRLVGGGVTETPKQITADLQNGKLYWCDREGMRVMRAGLDGSDVETLVVTGTRPRDTDDASHWPVGIAVDPKARQFYFTLKGNSDAGQGSICRAGYDLPDGETPETRSDVEVLFRNLPEPIDLEFDGEDGFLYWTDRGDLKGGNSLSRAAFDKTGRFEAEPKLLMQDLGEAIGLVVDHASGHIFVSSLNGVLYRARMDGSDQTVIGTFTGLSGIAKL